MSLAQKIAILEALVAELTARIEALEGKAEVTIPQELLEREAQRRELPAYLRSVPGVVEVPR